MLIQNHTSLHKSLLSFDDEQLKYPKHLLVELEMSETLTPLPLGKVIPGLVPTTQPGWHSYTVHRLSPVSQSRLMAQKKPSVHGFGSHGLSIDVEIGEMMSFPKGLGFRNWFSDTQWDSADFGAMMSQIAVGTSLELVHFSNSFKQSTLCNQKRVGQVGFNTDNIKTNAEFEC